MTDYYTSLQGNLDVKKRLMIKDSLISRSRTDDSSEEDIFIWLGYRLLVHAELENYFENICSYILDITKQLLDNNIYTKVTTSLLGHVDNSKNKNKPLNEKVYEAINSHKSKIKGNHGITETYLINLFTPVGLNDLLDINLLNDLKILADKRGEAAHKSTVGATYTTAFHLDLENINNIELFIKDFDEQIDKYVRYLNSLSSAPTLP